MILYPPVCGIPAICSLVWLPILPSVLFGNGKLLVFRNKDHHFKDLTSMHSLRYILKAYTWK